MIPKPILDTVRRARSRPAVGRIDFGQLRSLSPVSRDWGFDRGVPIDRYYIEQFLATHSSDVHGGVLEIAGDEYTHRFGGAAVSRSDVMNHGDDNPRATIIADLTDAPHVESDSFDCIICTQTLQLIFDVHAAVRTLYRLLRPGAVLLVTVPAISKISREDMDATGDYWRFTSASAKRVFEQSFPADHVQVGARGNVLAAVAFLKGIATEELTPEELDYIDRDFETLITVRAVKPKSDNH